VSDAAQAAFTLHGVLADEVGTEAASKVLSVLLAHAALAAAAVGDEAGAKLRDAEERLAWYRTRSTLTPAQREAILGEAPDEAREPEASIRLAYIAQPLDLLRFFYSTAERPPTVERLVFDRYMEKTSDVIQMLGQALRPEGVGGRSV
jgi:hypothetical protein